MDSLRALAIALVMLSHYPQRTGLPVLDSVARVGWIGVDLFFVLSGFLIAGQCLRDRPSLGGFYLRRALRILPSYLVVLALYLGLPALREESVMPPAWKFLTFTQNFGLEFSAFSHAWSLCVEEHFYLVLPLLILALQPRPDGRRVAAAGFAVLLAGLLARGWCWRHFLADNPGMRVYFTRIYYPSYNRLDGLLFGVLLAAIRYHRPRWWSGWLRRGNWFFALGLACGAGALGMFRDRYSLWPSLLGFPLLSLGFAALLVAAMSPRCLLGRARLPGGRAVAALAFTLYLTHKALMHLTVKAVGAEGPLPFVVSVAVCAAGASALHCLVERPFLELRDRLHPVPQHSVPVPT